jgi:hypothetical protein
MCSASLGTRVFQLTVDTYGNRCRWGTKGAVDRLDALAEQPSGSKNSSSGNRAVESYVLVEEYR